MGVIFFANKHRFGPTPMVGTQHLVASKRLLSGANLAAGQNANVTNIINQNRIQTKLKVGDSNDPMEREADRVAQHVVSLSSATSESAPPIQGGASHTIQRKCQECEEEQIQLKSKHSGNANLDPGLSSIAHSASHSLPKSTNQFMSKSIGYDFSDVKLHTDGAAQSMNQQLGARAFTLGSDIYFNHQQYQPQSIEGQRLLAHELTHVVQQSRTKPLIQKQDGPPSEIPLTSDVGAFWFRANENGRIEFVYGTPQMPLVGERGVGFRCEDSQCSPIVSGDASIGELGDTYTFAEAMALLNGDDPAQASPLAPLGVCATQQRNALGFCCPDNMIADGATCAPMTPFVPTLPYHSGIPSPDGSALGPAIPSLTQPQLGDSLMPGYSAFPTTGLVTFDRFEFNQHEVPSSSRSGIADLALRLSILAMAHTGTVLITGYTDAIGEQQVNVQLGLRRANAVKQALIEAGVAESAIIVDSAGESDLVVDSQLEQPLNRRVEVFYIYSRSHFGRGFGHDLTLSPSPN